MRVPCKFFLHYHYCCCYYYYYWLGWVDVVERKHGRQAGRHTVLMIFIFPTPQQQPPIVTLGT